VTEPRPLPPGLYLVSSPIGNLRDVTLRALEVLAGVDLVACEDTRVTARLLARHGIRVRTVSYHAHNERRQCRRLLAALKEEKRVALITDAGTPAVSDPGLLLVREARQSDIPVLPIPGPSAVTAALAASGLPAHAFTFLGFLPPRRGPRRKALSQAATLPHTLVLFEAPHRLAASLADSADLLGPRRAALCRELTKLHEEVRVDRLDRLAAEIAARRTVKGEITLVIAPPEGARAPARGLTPEAASGTSPETGEAKEADETCDGMTGHGRRPELPPLAGDYRQALAEHGGDRNAALRALARRRRTTRNALYRELLDAGILGSEAS
jgi:16S rRNA (cytidine1402-2'-O)-methyltransferase